MIKLSVGSPEAGVCKGLVRPERQVGIETATEEESMGGLSAGAVDAAPTLGFHTRMSCVLAVHHYGPVNSRRQRWDGRGLFHKGGENPAGSTSRAILLDRAPCPCWRRCVGLVGLSLNLYPFQCPVSQHLTFSLLK